MLAAEVRILSEVAKLLAEAVVQVLEAASFLQMEAEFVDRAA